MRINKLKPTDEVKHFYLEQLERIVSYNRPFELYVHNTGATVDKYYIIGKMTDGCLAVYSPFGLVEIVRRFNVYGFPETTGIQYKLKRWSKKPKTHLDEREINLVKRVRELIKMYKNQTG